MARRTSGVTGPGEMRTLVVTPWYPHEGDGAGSFVEDQVRSIASEHEPVVLHLMPAAERSSPVETDGPWPVIRIAAPASPVPGVTFLRDAGRVASAVLRLRRRGFRPDLIHAHVYTAALAAVPAARASRVPLVVSEHYSGLARAEVPRRERLAAMVAYRAADVVCPASESLRRQLFKFAPGARMQVMPNPVDERRFALPEPAPESGPPRVLTIASLLPIKGVDVLIEAVSAVVADRRDWQLTVIGDGPARSTYEQSVRNAGVGDLIRFVGRRSRDEVAHAMQEAAFLVAPSRWETFSVAVAEALCCGLPVVASRVGALPELVNESNGRLVEPDHPAALAPALADMLDAYKRFDRRAIASEAAERWGARRVGARWSELYEELAAPNSRHPSR
jgi:glycosyltransferase involved in cell wall biosynthesis